MDGSNGMLPDGQRGDTSYIGVGCYDADDCRYD